MMSYFLILGLLSFGFIYHYTQGLKCLSCRDISKPRLCEHYDECGPTEVCSLQQYSSLSGVVYDVGCVPTQNCQNSSTEQRRNSHDAFLCRQCCSDDFCNSGGCGAPGYPENRGPICHNCQNMRNVSKCRSIEVCSQQEECYFGEEPHFEEMFYTSKCERSHVCDFIRTQPSIIGRSVDNPKCSSSCVFCCSSDLCNSDSQEISTTIQTTTADFSAETLYMLMFLKNYDTPSHKHHTYLVILTNIAGGVMIRDPTHKGFRNITLQTGVNTYNYTMNIEMEQNVVEKNKSIVVETSMPVSVYTMNYEDGTSDGSFVFPVSKCSTRYIVPSYAPYNEYYRSVIGIGNLNNNTNISAVIKINGGSTAVINSVVYSSGDSIPITLQQYETFQLSSSYDLTGTEIISSHPVCVFAGTSCTHVVESGCSHLSEMIPPTSAFSDSYIFPTLYKRPQSVIRVLSEEDGTAVSLNSQTITLQSKQFHDFTVNHNASNIITSNKTVLVMLYAIEKGNSDAFMMTIPDVSQYLHEYLFYVPDAGFTSYLSVVIESSEMSGLRLDNNYISPLSSSSVSVDMNNKHYVTFAVDIIPGGHYMRHTGGVKFGLFVYGRQTSDGYGYPAGYDF